MRGRLYTGSFAVVLLMAMLVMTGCPKKAVIETDLGANNTLDFGTFCGDTTKTFTVTNAGGGTLKWSLSESEDWLEVTPTSGSLKKAKTAEVTVKVLAAKLTEDVAKEGSITFTASNKGVVGLTVRITAKKDCVVNKTNPSVTWPTASLTYGQKLSDATLVGGVGAGVFTFDDPNKLPTVAESGAFAATFTPTDTASYNVLSGTIVVTVAKAAPAGVIFPLAALTFGQTLADAQLTGGAGAGNFSFDAPTTAPTVAESGAFAATFTPTDTANYALVTGIITVTVNKAAFTGAITWPTAAAITYGQTLADALLSGGVGAGTFAFDAPTTVPSVPGGAFAATFTPTDGNYAPVASTISVTVNKATFTGAITWPTAASIAYGQTLADALLSGGVGAGTFAFDAPTTVPPFAGGSFPATFTPTDGNYAVVTNLINVTVTGGVVIDPDQAQLVEGDTLTLTANSHPLAHDTVFQWNVADPTVLTYTSGVLYNEVLLTAALRLNDLDATTSVDVTGNVSASKDSVQVKVIKNVVTVLPVSGTVEVGQTLTLTASALSNSDTFAWGSGNDLVATVAQNDGYTATVTGIAAGGSVEITATGDVTKRSGKSLVTVIKATPVVTFPTASLTYGQTLAQALQTGGAGSGVFTFVAPTTQPTVAESGTAYAATFTPTDAANYNTVSGTIVVTVNKDDPTGVVFPTAALTYGQTLAQAIPAGGSGAGAFTFDAPSTVPTVAQSGSSYAATFTPTDAANYNTVSGTIVVTVSKATPAVTFPTATLTYGQTLAQAQLAGGVGVGTFIFTNPGTMPTVADSGTAYPASFTPTDSANFNAVIGSIVVTVSKATPVVTFPTASVFVDQTLADALLSGGVSTPAGAFTFDDPTRVVSLADDAQAFAATFTPTNVANYNVVAGTITLTVFGGVAIAPTSASLIEGDTLTLSATSSPSIAGDTSFIWNVVNPAVASLSTSGVLYNEVVLTALLRLNGLPATTAIGVTGNPSASNASITVSVAPNVITVLPVSGTIEVGQTLALTASALSKSDAIYWGSENSLLATVTANGLYAVDGVYAATVTGVAAGGPVNITATGTVTSRSDSSAITVAKATPQVTWPSSASLIVLGSSLASSVLSGDGSAINPWTNAPVAGSFAFANPAIVPPAGSYSASIVFTPADTANYSSVTGTIAVEVSTAVFVDPTEATLYEGDRVQLTPDSGAGDTAFDWLVAAPTAVAIEEVGEIYAWVTALHQDSDVSTVTDVTVTGATSALSATAKIYVLVNTVTVSPATPGTIEVGETIKLSATTNTIRDQFEWSTVGAATALSAGALYNEQVVTGLYAGSTSQITATGTESGRSDTVDVTVVKTTPVVSVWPTGTLTYGQTLAQTAFTGGSVTNPHTGLAVPGTWVFSSPSDVPTVSSNRPFVASFVPDNEANYNLVAGQILVTISKADPGVTWPTATLYYGQTLAQAVQFGDVGDGVFTFANPSLAPTVSDSGTDYPATFTPADTANYNVLQAVITVTVSKASPAVTWPTAAIFLSQTLADAEAVVSGGSAVNPYSSAGVSGTYTFLDGAFAPPLGTLARSAVFTPTDVANYNPVTSSILVTVSNPVSVAPTSAALYEGDTIELSATSQIVSEVSFAWLATDLTAVSLAESGGAYCTVTALHQASGLDSFAQVTLTGADSGGVATADITVRVNTVAVTPATTTIEVGETTTLTASSFTVNDTTFALETTSTAVATVAAGALYNQADVTGVGVGEATITMTGEASQRSDTAVITVAKATPTVVAPTAAVYYGNALSTAVFTGGSAVNPHSAADIPGTWVFEFPGDVLSTCGNHLAHFVPTDSLNYNITSAEEIVVTVPLLEIVGVDAPGVGGNGESGGDAAGNQNTLKVFTAGIYGQNTHIEDPVSDPDAGQYEAAPSGGWTNAAATDALDIYYYGDSDSTGLPNVIVSWVVDDCNPDFYRPQAFGGFRSITSSTTEQAVVTVVGLYTLNNCATSDIAYTPLATDSFPNVIDFTLGCLTK